MATSVTNKAQKTTGELKERVVNINKKALTAADDLINGSIKTGEKWQKLYAKSLKKTQPLIEKQIDMAFDTAESLIDQYQAGTKRIRQIFNMDRIDAKKMAASATKTVKASAKKATATAAKKTTEAVTKVTTATNKAKATAKTTTITDLKKIAGIGPKMETLLKSVGIKDVAALAKANAEELKATLVKSDTRLGMLNPSLWIEAAKTMTK